MNNEQNTNAVEESKVGTNSVLGLAIVGGLTIIGLVAFGSSKIIKKISDRKLNVFDDDDEDYIIDENIVEVVDEKKA